MKEALNFKQQKQSSSSLINIGCGHLVCRGNLETPHEWFSLELTNSEMRHFKSRLRLRYHLIFTLVMVYYRTVSIALQKVDRIQHNS